MSNPTTTDYAYVGTELELFSGAKNWKAYFHSHVAPYVRGDVLEVGAGIGGTTQVLCDGNQKSWLCLEPDPTLAEQLQANLNNVKCPFEPRTLIGFLDDVPRDRTFDTITYVDVVEHIEEDKPEVEKAAARLRSGGSLILLCPAINYLYSEFDRAIGHHRRYNKQSFRKLTPPGTKLVSLFYLDSVGLLLSLANKWILHQSHPTKKQVQTWDRFVIPMSKWVDRLLCFGLGKTIVGIWQKQD